MTRALAVLKASLATGLAVVVLAGAGMSAARQIGLAGVSDEDVLPPDEPITCAGEMPDPGCEEAPEGAGEEAGPGVPAREAEEADGDSDARVSDPEREAACAAAAGEAETPAEGEAPGLDRAIEAVSGNCVKNPQAPGLLQALQRLAENRDRAHGEGVSKTKRKGKGKKGGPGGAGSLVEELTGIPVGGSSGGAPGKTPGGNGKGKGKGKG